MGSERFVLAMDSQWSDDKASLFIVDLERRRFLHFSVPIREVYSHKEVMPILHACRQGKSDDDQLLEKLGKYWHDVDEEGGFWRFWLCEDNGHMTCPEKWAITPRHVSLRANCGDVFEIATQFAAAMIARHGESDDIIVDAMFTRSIELAKKLALRFEQEGGWSGNVNNWRQVTAF